jgi:hypothetical protein
MISYGCSRRTRWRTNDERVSLQRVKLFVVKLMKSLAEVEFRCREHENHVGFCDICLWLQQFEEDLQLVKNHRARLHKELEKRLAEKKVIMVAIR